MQIWDVQHTCACAKSNWEERKFPARGVYPQFYPFAHAQRGKNSGFFSSKSRFLLEGPSESIWLRKFPKCRFRLHKHQRVSSSVCLFLIRFTIPTQASNVLHHHIMLKLKLPYFPLSQPQHNNSLSIAFICTALSITENPT